MTPELRRKNERRRRVWAAPFVLTMALAPAVACKKAPEPSRTNNPPGPVVEEPKPAAASDAAVATAPADAMPWSSSTARVVARLEQGADGCRWIFGADCEPNTKCNPPAPRKVDCPKEGPGDVELLADGECRITLDPNCPIVDGVAPPCNPPAPSKLPCPPDAE